MEDGCVKQENNTSCIQETYGFMSNFCSIWLSYTAMGILLLSNGIGWINNIKAWRIMNKHFKNNAHTPALGRKEHLVHSSTYHMFMELSKVGLFLNIILRFVRHMGLAYIPTFADILTYYFIYFGFVWIILFIIQLAPYIGFVAVVLKLMMKDTFIFLLFILISSVPYVPLFIRVVNHKVPSGECDPNWKYMESSTYSIFLLLFNMINFSQNDGSGRTQLIASIMPLF